MTDWKIEEQTTTKNLTKDSLQAVSQGFDGQLRQAKLKAEYDALLKESKYNEMREDNHTEDEWLNGKPSAKLMKLLNRYQMMVENGRKVTSKRKAGTVDLFRYIFCFEFFMFF